MTESEKLEQAMAALEAQRFADVSGFTAMSETLDPEDVRDTMNALWERLDAVILSHGGHIDKHMGDGVMALWGADETREDDPERAIQAALAMQAELASFRPTLQAVSSLKMRIGINTGPILLGQIGMRGEITAMGDTVNLAARLEQSCPAGGILISHDTYRHVRGIFDVDPQKLLEVKGKAEPVQTYLVLLAKPRAFRLSTRGVEGVETHMIGREREMALLQEAFRQATFGRRFQAVTILGDAGIGKSRLLYEFNTWAELQTIAWWWFKGRASLSLMNTPYALLRDFFAFRFEIQDSDLLEVAHRKLEAGFREFLPGDPDVIEKAHVIGHLIGLNFSASPHLRGLLHDPRQLRQQALFYLTQFFHQVSEQFPVLMMIDDLQWADTGSLDALTYLFANLPPETPFMALSVARSTLFEHYPRWGSEIPNHVQVVLKALTKAESRRLVGDILRRVSELPEAVRELVVGGAEGNPFYLEELIKMLIDARVILPGEEQWLVEPSRLATVRVPPTLTEVLQARLDTLTIPERQVLQHASVLGRIFWDQAVQVMSETLTARDIQEALQGLLRKELIFERRPAVFKQTREYTFKHSLLQEVAYETLLKRNRQAYHLQAAQWLNQVSGERRMEYLPQIAEHFEKGGEPARAASAFSEAADRALNLSALAEARSFFQHALNLLNQPAQSIQQAVAMEVGLAETCIQLGDYQQAKKHAENAAAIAGEMQIDIMVAEALNQLGQLSLLVGNLQDAHSYLVGALYLARKENVPPSVARILIALGNVEWRLGALAMAREFCEEALQIATQLADTNLRIQALNRLGVVYGALNLIAEETHCYETSLTLAQEIGNRERAATALNNLGAQAGEQNQWREARDYYQRALDVSRITGAQHAIALHLINLGLSEVNLRQFAEARGHLGEGARLARQIGAWPLTVAALIYFALLSQATGNLPRALELLHAARQHPVFDSENEREISIYSKAWEIDSALERAAAERARQLDFDHLLDELTEIVPI